jgi:hypothetical protein
MVLVRGSPGGRQRPGGGDPGAQPDLPVSGRTDRQRERRRRARMLGQAMSRGDDERDHGTLRELALSTPAGAYLYGNDAIRVPSSPVGDRQVRSRSGWLTAAVCMAWVALFVALRLTR